MAGACERIKTAHAIAQQHMKTLFSQVDGHQLIRQDMVGTAAECCKNDNFDILRRDRGWRSRVAALAEQFQGYGDGKFSVRLILGTGETLDWNLMLLDPSQICGVDRVKVTDEPIGQASQPVQVPCAAVSTDQNIPGGQQRKEASVTFDLAT